MDVVGVRPSSGAMGLPLEDMWDPISRELQVRNIESVAQVDLGDFFRIEIGRGSIDTDERSSMTVSVASFIGAEPFEAFDIDLTPFDATTESELSPLALRIATRMST